MLDRATRQKVSINCTWSSKKREDAPQREATVQLEAINIQQLGIVSAEVTTACKHLWEQREELRQETDTNKYLEAWLTDAGNSTRSEVAGASN